MTGGRRPIVGLSTYVEPARWVAHNAPAAILHMSYVDAVREAGGRAVLLPPDDIDDGVLELLDGLIITGGADVEPARYGAEPHRTTVCRPDRDAGELALLRGAWERDIAVLGVCRGMQLMAVAAGGTLHQHLPELLGSEHHRPGPFDRVVFGSHEVELAEGSRCRSVLGDRLQVNSLHHQAVADPGKLTATGWCVEDGLIEAVEDPTRRFSVGVQWHPEESDREIITALVRAAAR